MRAASSGLIAFLKSRQPCYKADLFTITLADGSVDLRTSFDSDLTYGASTWLARGPLISRSGISVRNTPEIPEMTVTLKAPPSYQYFGAPIRQQVVNGIFDGASFQLNRTFMPTPGDTSLGIPVMFLGKKSGIKQVGDLITITVKGGNVTLNQFAPKNVYQTACSHTFCDAGCTLNAASFTISKAVGSSPQPLLIPWNSAPGDPGDYTLGKIKMTSGASAGQTRQIKFADSSGIVPAYPFDDGVSAGDTFTAMQGCDKTVTRCTALSNLQHYRGFPFIPSASSAI